VGQTYPSRPVRIIVGRGRRQWVGHCRAPVATMAVRASRSGVLGREPAGADGNIATEAVVRSPTDGHTLLLVISANTINATLYDKLSFVLFLLRRVSPLLAQSGHSEARAVCPRLGVKRT
jgi:tripartite-type tricarboxylate transporter receptor subunit TctC